MRQPKSHCSPEAHVSIDCRTAVTRQSLGPVEQSWSPTESPTELNRAELNPRGAQSLSSVESHVENPTEFKAWAPFWRPVESGRLEVESGPGHCVVHSTVHRTAAPHHLTTDGIKLRNGALGFRVQ